MTTAGTVNANNAQDGQWSEIIQWTPHIPSSIVNLPDGRILSWNSRDPDEAKGQSRELGFTLSAIYDPQTGQFITTDNSLHGMFCAGISLLENGSVLVSGGVPDTPEVSMFDLQSSDWREIPDMNRARYYPTAVTMPDNNVFLSHARSAGNTSEVFDSNSFDWSLTPNASQQTLVSEKIQIDSNRVRGNNASTVQWYAHLSVAPNGKILHAGPTQTWHYFDPMNGSGNQALGKLTGDRARIYGNLINYGVGKVMLVGGHDPSKQQAVSTDTVYLVDMNGASPVVKQGPSMKFARTYTNSVIMPNGEIIVIGGETSGANYRTDNVRLTPEIYNPNTNSWRTAADMAVPRVYHSTALLMKDGRVISAGGGVCGNRCPSPTSNQQNAQIYSPSYLFNNDGSLRARPSITDAPDQVTPGSNIKVKASHSVKSFSLLRLSGTTHHINADQRYLPLNVTGRSGDNFTLSLPANPNVLLPGFYWLFALDENGTPSIGETVQVVRDLSEQQGIGFYTAGTVNKISAQEYQITPDKRVQLGAVNTTYTVDMTKDFTMSVELFFGHKDGNGADGVTVTMHSGHARAMSKIFGPGLGAWGINNGLAFEFDTYRNGGTIADPPFDHFSVWDTDSGQPTSAGNPNTPPMTQVMKPVALDNLENGQWHPFKMKWDASEKILTLSLNGRDVGRLNSDLVTDYFGGLKNVRFAVTGATGGLSNDQRMRNFTTEVQQAPSERTFITSGSATKETDTEFQITPDKGGQLGAANSSFTANLKDDFDISVELFFGSKDVNGADGMTVTLHDGPTNTISSIYGPGLGAWGINNGLAFEFDTYSNGGSVADPITDHFAVWDTDTGQPTNIGNPWTPAMEQVLAPVTLSNLEDGKWHTFDMKWNASKKILALALDGAELGSVSGDLVNKYLGGSHDVRFAITGATGGLSNSQRMRNFVLYDKGFTHLHDIDITNSDFESQVLNDRKFTRNTIVGWNTEGPQNGVWNPNANMLNGTTANTAYIDSGGRIFQTLQSVLTKNTDYALSFKIGGGGFERSGSSSWQAKFFAGSTLLGSVSNVDFDPANNQLIDARLVLSAADIMALAPEYGTRLTIEFSDSGRSNNVYFDDVSLAATVHGLNADSDNDGVKDNEDSSPFDPSVGVDESTSNNGSNNNNGGTPSTGIIASRDSDGDGVIDSADPYPNDSGRGGLIKALPSVPQQSSTLIVERTSNGDRLWNVNPDNNTVTVSSSAGDVINEIDVGDSPWSLIKSTSKSLVYVTNKKSSTISVIDTKRLSVVNTIDLPKHSQPHGIVFDRNGEHYYVVLEALSELQKRSAEDNSLVARLALRGVPRHLSLSYDNANVYVSNFITPTFKGEDSFSPALDRAAAEVFVVDPTSMTLKNTITLGHDNTPVGESVGPGLPNYLGAAAITFDSKVAYLPSKKDNIGAGTSRNKPGMTFDQTVRAHTSIIDLVAGTNDSRLAIDHDNASVATSAAFSGENRYLFVTLETSRELVVYDTSLGFELMRLETGRAPQSVALSSNGSFAYVHNFMDRSISRYDLREAFVSEAPVKRELPRIDVVAKEVLTDQVLLGKQHFYDAADERLARDSYMSCASCHKEGKDDGRIWDFTQFGEGLRNTTSLLGKGNMSLGMLHWTGNFDEFQDFEAQIRGFAGGSGLMTDSAFLAGSRSKPLGDRKAGISADLDALAAYLHSLTEAPTSPYAGTDDEQDVVEGRRLFAKYNCGSCHSGTQKSDSALGKRHNIGTIKQTSGKRMFSELDGFDTPSLVGIWESPPYLHDGSAATIQEAINAHKTVDINRNDVDKITKYLRQLNVEFGEFVTTGVADRASEQEYLITPDQLKSVGAVNSVFTIDMRKDVEISVELFFGNKDDNGADGMTLTLHSGSEDAISSAYGPGLGAWGIRNGLAFEFDTYRNGGNLSEPAQDHFSVWDTDTGRPTVDGNPWTPVMAQVLPPVTLNNLEDGQWHTLHIRWDASNQTMTVSLDGIGLGRVTGNLIDNYFAGEHNVRIAVTGATGALSNEQRMRALMFTR